MDLAAAVRNHEIIEFTYDGLERVVQPATYGMTSTGKPTLRGCQIGGRSHRHTPPCWELYTEAKIVGAISTGQTFGGFALAGYTRGDSGFTTILAEH